MGILTDRPNSLQGQLGDLKYTVHRLEEKLERETRERKDLEREVRHCNLRMDKLYEGQLDQWDMIREILIELLEHEGKELSQHLAHVLTYTALKADPKGGFMKRYLEWIDSVSGGNKNPSQ